MLAFDGLHEMEQIVEVVFVLFEVAVDLDYFGGGAEEGRGDVLA